MILCEAKRTFFGWKLTKGMILDLICSLETKDSASPSILQQKISQVSHITLLRISLLHFLRKSEDPPTFPDLFDSILGKDSNTSHVEKLYCLITSSRIGIGWSRVLLWLTCCASILTQSLQEGGEPVVENVTLQINFRSDFMLAIQFPDIIIYSYQYWGERNFASLVNFASSGNRRKFLRLDWLSLRKTNRTRSTSATRTYAPRIAVTRCDFLSLHQWIQSVMSSSCNLFTITSSFARSLSKLLCFLRASHRRIRQVRARRLAAFDHTRFQLPVIE